MVGEPVGREVELRELVDSYVGLTPFLWIADPARAEVRGIRSEYTRAGKEAFDGADIETPYPYRQLTDGIETADGSESRTGN